MATRKLDDIAGAAVDLARQAAVDEAGEEAIGEYLGASAEAGDRLVTHSFECRIDGYPDWRWAVTVVRASRAKASQP